MGLLLRRLGYLIQMLTLMFCGCSFALAQAPQNATMPPPAFMPGTSASNLISPDFTRAIIVDSMNSAIHTPVGIRDFVQTARLSGFDTIIFQVRSTGDACYKSSLVPMAQGIDPKTGFDPLDTVLNEAHSGKTPMKVYAMFTALRVWKTSMGIPPTDHIVSKSPTWLTVSQDGNNMVRASEQWLDCALPAVQEHLTAVVNELVASYALDGIVFDRMRAPDNSLVYGYSSEAVALYNSENHSTGIPVPTDSKWGQWRRDKLTSLVSKLSVAVKQTRPTCRVGVMAGTGGTFPKGRDEWMMRSEPCAKQLQDWVKWCEMGIIDDCVLSNLRPAENMDDFIGWMRFAIANRGKSRMVIALASWMNQPQVLAAMMLVPIVEPNAGGVALYCSGALNENNLNSLMTHILKSTNVANIAPLISTSFAPGSAFSNPKFWDGIVNGAGLNNLSNVLTYSSPAQPREENSSVFSSEETTASGLSEEMLPPPAAPDTVTPSIVPVMPNINELNQVDLPGLDGATAPVSGTPTQGLEDVDASQLTQDDTLSDVLLPSNVPVGGKVSIPNENSGMTNFMGIPMQEEMDDFQSPKFSAPKIKSVDDLGAYTELGVPVPDAQAPGRSRSKKDVGTGGFQSYIDRPASMKSSGLPNPSVTQSAETILLKSGRQFSGKVTKRGADAWTIKLPNGSEIKIPSSQLSTTLKPETPKITPPPLQNSKAQ